MPPLFGAELAMPGSPVIPRVTSMTASRAAASARQAPPLPTVLPTASLLRQSMIGCPIGVSIWRRWSTGDLSRSGASPPLELLEEIVLFLLAHRLSTGRLPALVEKARKHRFHIARARRGGHRRIALQPLIRRRIAPPARKLRRDVDLLPLAMMTRGQQRRKTGEEGVDEIA